MVDATSEITEPVCRAVLIAVLVGVGVGAALAGTASISTWLALAAALPLALALLLVQRGHVRAGAWLMTVSIYVLLVIAAAWMAPVEHVAHLFATAILVCGLVLGSRAIAGLALVSGGLVVGLLYADANGFLPEPEFPGTTTPLMATLTGVAVAAWSVSQAVSATERARWAWQGTNEQLRELLASREAEVFQRTVELTEADARLHDEAEKRALMHEDLVELSSEAEAATRAKVQFVANMSHELRTPLNGILGLGELLSRQTLDLDASRQVEAIRHCATVMLGLVEDVLELSSLDAAPATLDNVQFEIAVVLEETLAPLRAVAAARALKLELSIDPAIPTLLCGDAGRFAKISRKLTDNAVKFTREGGVRVDVVLAGSEAQRVHVRVRVCDSGEGMSEEVVARVYEPFVQSDESDTRKHGGAGLGLTLARRLVNELGGVWLLESAPGLGTTVEFTLPFAIAPDRPSHNPAALDVLIVEDNPVNLEIIHAMVTRLGHGVTLVEDGIAALEALNTRPFDLVLLDCQLPGMDGPTIACAVRANDGPNRNTPLVAVTAHSTDAYRELTRASGMNAFVPKPVDFQRLRETIAQLVSDDSPRTSSQPGSNPPAMEYPTNLDPDVLAELRMLDAMRPGTLAEISRLFLDTVDQRVEMIANAETLDVVVQAAHALKGSSGALGASELCMIAGEIERDARAGQAPAAQLATLRRALEAVRPAITALK